ncbi:MAG: Ig-like domain-containing protein, partial [Oscillospiraceae bacterium]|nr:Ig-like domain-containing protein [Oscillospiraceae bacterium]
VLTPLNAGVTTITLTVNGVSASCTVTVRASLKSMLLPETVYAVAKGGVQLPLQLVPADAAVELTYTMAADNFGSISSTGWITAPSYITTPSTTTITVRDEMSGKEATTQLCITYPVTAISFAQPTVQVMGGESALLTANVTMRSDSCVNQLVTFTSSDTGIATVDAFGCVKGFKPGSATITATADSGVTATCEVIVGASGLSGDLSGDEAVTMDDVLALMDSLADPDGYSDVADVDKDADVDQDDMLLLMQYLSGWGVKLQ